MLMHGLQVKLLVARAALASSGFLNAAVNWRLDPRCNEPEVAGASI
jgi:hypothetical protein